VIPLSERLLEAKAEDEVIVVAKPTESSTIESGCQLGKMVRNFSVIFWDFDGVIKDSVEVKTQAYFKLFEPFGLGVAEKVRQHHEANGGMSRFDKLPIYLQWAGLEVNKIAVSEYCNQFSQQVLQGVIAAPWVGGVEQYLRSNVHQQMFVLVSATPQDELEYILHALDLINCFAEIYGTPTTKQNAIRNVLFDRSLDARDALMIGDAQADLDAANANQVPFLLRLHSSNTKVFSTYTGASVEDFTTL
jgi:phosphoglycolate phosphatase-like HAD superfamily hydrolase